MTESTYGNVLCRDCDKLIGNYTGKGQVIGICNDCYEALH